MNAEELLIVWEKFTEKNDFVLNPDKEHVAMIVKGLLANEKKIRVKVMSLQSK